MKKNKFILVLSIAAIFYSLPLAAQEVKELFKSDLATEINDALDAPQSGCEIPVKSAKPSLRDDLRQNFVKLGGDPTALSQALCFYDKHRSSNFKAVGDPSRAKGIKMDNLRFITINDLTKNINESRLFILDLETGKVQSLYSMHGIGGEKGVARSDHMAREFSNKDSSYATPRGFFVTGSRINFSSDRLQRWSFSMKLHGVQAGVNDNSYLRAIIMHAYPGVNSQVASSDDENPSLSDPSGGYTLSWGCTMIGPEIASEVIDKLKAKSNNSGGSLYYNYTPIEKSRGDSYCGDEGLLIKKP